jgi:2-dehydropantoate 2-reductase
LSGTTGRPAPDAAPEFAILGAGVLGSVIGAHLARAGHPVLLLARGARAQQIEAQGLRIRGLVEFDQRVPVLTDPAAFAGAQCLIVTTKTYSMDAALAPLRQARIGVAFSFQNGLMKNEQLAAAFGAERVLGAIANTSGELLPGGEVLFTRNEQLCVGELSGGLSERAHTIAQAIDAAGVHTSAAADIQSLEWAKFASWAALMVLSITMRTETWRYMSDPDAARLLARLVREVGALATASGVALTDQSMLPVASLCASAEPDSARAIQALGEQLRVRAPRHRMSTLQDLQAGRPLEVEETLGYAARKAEQLGLALPLLQASYTLARAIDRSGRQLSG